MLHKILYKRHIFELLIEKIIWRRDLWDFMYFVYHVLHNFDQLSFYKSTSQSVNIFVAIIYAQSFLAGHSTQTTPIRDIVFLS